MRAWILNSFLSFLNLEASDSSFDFRFEAIFLGGAGSTFVKAEWPD